MKAIANTFVVALASVAAAAAIGVGLADHAAAPATEVVQLERVVVVGKRADLQATTVVAKLPRVVIEHRREVATVAAIRPVARPA